jgi:ribose 5-phosphate isomerase A
MRSMSDKAHEYTEVGHEMPVHEKEKKEASVCAVEEIKPGMILGLGTGTTVFYALEEIGTRMASGLLREVAAIPSSNETERLARRFGIPLTTFDVHAEIDLNIDGADEIDPSLNLIKGGGGALLREKIMAQVSRRTIIVADEGKLSHFLGEKRPVPVEVIPFAWKAEAGFLASIASRAERREDGSGRPFTTDQGNFIIDCHFAEIQDPLKLALFLSQRAAIMAHGLFMGLASEVIIGGPGGIRRMKRSEQ